MPLDHVAIDQSSMAGVQTLRHAVLVLDVGQVLAEHVFFIDLKTVLL